MMIFLKNDYLSSCRYFLNFDFHYFTGVTALTHTLFTPHFSENVTLLRSFHTFGPEIALNPHGLTLSTGEGVFGAPEGRDNRQRF